MRNPTFWCAGGGAAASQLVRLDQECQGSCPVSSCELISETHTFGQTASDCECIVPG